VKRQLILLVVGFLIAALLLAGCSSQAPAPQGGNSQQSQQGQGTAQGAIQIKYAVVGPDDHPYTIMAKKFKELVEDKTNGQVQVTIFPNAQLGSEREMAEGVRMGTIQMTTVTSDGTLPAWTPELQVFSIPYLFRDRDHAYKVLDGNVGKELGDKLLAQGLRSLGFCELGWRHFTNNVRPIAKPEDAKGLKIRVQEAKVWFSLVKALGATPTPIPFGELYTALQQRTVDGQENPVATIRSMKFYEVQKYLTLDGHTYSAGSVLINPKFYDSLSPDIQKAIQDSATEAISYQREVIAQKEAEDLQFLKDKGMEVTEPDRNAFVEATKNVPEEVKDMVPLELVEQVRNTK
jgi:tripartite ATP-independent transporter DctP family solute receptor